MPEPKMDTEVLRQLYKIVEKQSAGKPEPVRRLMQRTLNTSTVIISTLKDIPFEKVSSSLFFFLPPDERASQLAREYESQIEFACVKPIEFAKKLHKFYNEMAIKLKKNEMFPEFFSFLSVASKARLIHMDKLYRAESNISLDVLNSIMSLLLQQTEYIRPSKFDFTTVVCGCTTTGELMTMPDLFPNLDQPGFDIVSAEIKNERPPATPQEYMEILLKRYADYGYPASSFDDIDRLGNVDRIFSNHIAAMLPYINEYTFDIIRDLVPFSANALPFFALHTDVSSQELAEKLKRRRRTLPTNGMEFKYDRQQSIINRIFMRELSYGDGVVMLYRLESMEGDLVGFYETQTGFLYTVFQELESDPKIKESLVSFILYSYACAVLADGDEMLADFSNHFWYAARKADTDILRITAAKFSHGGKLKNNYRADPNAEHTLRGARKGNDAYEEGTAAIQGYIRKVGISRSPSPEARARAEALGYDLAPDETYVQPFVRSVFRLKQPKS